MIRIVGRRPGKQMTPFEFVLIFFIGGLTLTAMVGDDVNKCIVHHCDRSFNSQRVGVGEASLGIVRPVD